MAFVRTALGALVDGEVSPRWNAIRVTGQERLAGLGELLARRAFQLECITSSHLRARHDFPLDLVLGGFISAMAPVYGGVLCDQ